MATVKGTDGKVVRRTTTGGTAEIAGIDTWELTANVDSDEITGYTDGREKKFLQTTVGWTGTISGTYHSSSTDGVQQALIDTLSSTGSGPGDVTLMLYGSSSPKDLYKGDFIIDSIANSGSLGTKRSFSASITANGGVKRTS